MESRIVLETADNQLANALARAARDDERILVEREGEILGAVISMADLRFFEELEDANDLRRARANVEASHLAREAPIPLAEATERRVYQPEPLVTHAAR